MLGHDSGIMTLVKYDEPILLIQNLVQKGTDEIIILRKYRLLSFLILHIFYLINLFIFMYVI